MEIKPFKAYRYRLDSVAANSDCIAPPYDVIDASQQQGLYDKSDYNIVRIIKGKVESSDNGQTNRYTRAADYLNSWIKKGIVKQDSSENFYAYVQDFELAGAWFQRYSFVALGKLEPFGKTVRAHEYTLRGPKKDRLELKKATGSDFGLVFVMYQDEQHIAEHIIEKRINEEPEVDFNDKMNVRHRLYILDDHPSIDAIKKMMENKTVIIADGHHRYETGVNYSEQSDDPAAKYQMMAFSNTAQKGLIVLATHRVVNNVDGFSFKEFVDKLEEKFDIEKLSFGPKTSCRDARHQMLDIMKVAHAKDDNTIGIYGGDGAFYVATLKDQSLMADAKPGMSQAWRKLDVAVLSQLVLEEILGIDKEKLADGGYVEYVKDSGNKAKELVRKIDNKEAQAVFFLNPPKIKQIQDVADSGERMPQKSTYFYPKVYTGLTIYKLQ